MTKLLQDERSREIRDSGCIGGVGRWAINIKELKKGDRYITEKYVKDLLNELAQSVKRITLRRIPRIPFSFQIDRIITFCWGVL